MFKKSPNRTLVTALFATLTVSGMALFFNLYDPWMPIGPDRIIDNGFETEGCTSEWTGWDSELARIDPEGGFNGSAGVVLSTTPKRHSRLKMTVSETESIPAFRVSARATAKNVERGPKSWNLPRTVFFYLNSSGKPLFNLSHGLFDIKQNSEWKRYTAVFPVPENIQNGQLQIQNFGKEGILRIDDISVIPVTPKPVALFFNIFFTLLWISALAACLASLQPWKHWSGAGAMLCSLVIIIGVVLPGEPLNAAISSTLDTLQDAQQKMAHFAKQSVARRASAEPTPEKIVIIEKQSEAAAPSEKDRVQYVHKAGHFALFTLLALLSMICWAPAQERAIRILCVTGGLYLFATATEVLQFVTFDRKAGLLDLSVDIAGISIAITAAAALSLPARRNRK